MTLRLIFAVSILAAAAVNSVTLAQVAISDRVVNADRYPQVRVNFPGGVVGMPKVTYYRPASRPVTLDLYLPPNAANGGHPFIVYVHGGGWSGGTPRTTGAFEDWPSVLASVAAKGYVVASVDYRLSGEAKFPAAVQDVKAAIKWLRTNATTYGVDKTRGLVWGPSAGGHLAALVGASCGAAGLAPVMEESKESDCVQAVVGWYGLYDFAINAAAAPSPAANAQDDRAGLTRFLGCNVRSCAQDVIRAANPVSYVDGSDPPMLFVHGDADRTALPEHSKRMHEQLKQKGVKTDLIMLPGIGHSWIGGTHAATIDASRFALEKTLAFIDSTIGAGRAQNTGSR